MRSLGQRALDVAQQELEQGVRERPLGSNDGPRIREYLDPCVRDVVTQLGDTTTVHTTRLNLGPTNWCMAFASHCQASALRSGERPAHGYRAAVVEAVADVQIGEGYAGRWLDIADVRAGKVVPSEGDLVVLTRAIASRKQTAWWRHVNRIESWHTDYYIGIGGNEHHKVRRAKHMVNNPRILGCIAYPPMRRDGSTRTPPTRPMLSESEREQILGQVALSIEGMLRSGIWQR